MWLYFPAANGLHPVPEHCQEKSSNNNRERGMELWLLWVLLKASTWQDVCQQRESDTDSFPQKPLPVYGFGLSFSFCLTSKLLVCTFHVFISFLISSSETTRKGTESSVLWPVRWRPEWNSTLKLYYPTPCPPGPEFMGYLLFWSCLIRHWYTSYVIQQLGWSSSPLIVSGMTHTSTQYLSTHGAFMHSFLMLSLVSSSSYQPHHHHLLPHSPFPLPLDPGSKCDIQWQTETFFLNTFFLLSMRSHT